MKTIVWNSENVPEMADLLLAGEVGVLPTDTLYGVLAPANNKEAVTEVYALKGRNPAKPVIILINSLDDLKLFEVTPTAWQKKYLEEYWPGPVSVILSCSREDLTYLHRGTKSLAFRMPNEENLRSLLRLTGPLIAPSANPEGLNPALSIKQAQEYFGEEVGFYADGGERSSAPSTLISLMDEKLELLRGKL